MHVLKFIVANNILRLRTDAEMSRAELGEKIRYSEDFVLRWERAEEMPDDDALAALAAAFGVTADYLLNPHDEWVSKEEKAYLENTSASAPNIETKNFRAKEDENEEKPEPAKKKKKRNPLTVVAVLVCVFGVFIACVAAGMFSFESRPGNMDVTAPDNDMHDKEEKPDYPIYPGTSGGFVGDEDHEHEYRDNWEVAIPQTPYENGEERRYCYGCDAYLYRPIYASTQGLFFENHGDGTCTVTGVGSASEESGDPFNFGLEIVVVPPYINDGEEVLRVVAVGDEFLSSLGASHDTIKEIILPETLERIGSHAFVPCRALRTVNIPVGVKTIGEYAFVGCESLESIELPDSLEYLGEGTFSGCTKLKWIDLPESITEILPFTFENCTSLEIFSAINITEIGAGAFMNCVSLTKMPIMNMLGEIGTEAFYGCTSLKDPHFGESISFIGERAFYGCTHLNSAKFEENGANLIIGNEAFRECDELYGLNIPARVTSIQANAFADCDHLSNLRINTAEISAGAFYGCGLSELHFGNEVYSIGTSAFEGCRALKEIKIPEGVKKIDYRAFYGCESVSYIEINASLEEIMSDAFDECNSLNSINLYDMRAEGYASLFYENQTITSVTVRNGLIYMASFENCTNLAFADLTGVDKIEYHAFRGCKALTQVITSDKLGSIGEYAFAQTAISEFNMTPTMVYIGEGAFADCSALKKINFSGTLEEWRTVSANSPGWRNNLPGGYGVYCADGNVTT